MTITDTQTWTLRIEALDPDELDRVRSSGTDAGGLVPRPVEALEVPGSLLRCCLREAYVGEAVLLIAWRPLRHAPTSPYAELGPVFVHAERCDGYRDTGSCPEAFRGRRQVLRSYTVAGDMLATTTTEGVDAEQAATRLLDDRAAYVVHSRSPEAGCFMFAVRCADDPPG